MFELRELLDKTVASCIKCGCVAPLCIPLFAPLCLPYCYTVLGQLMPFLRPCPWGRAPVQSTPWKRKEESSFVYGFPQCILGRDTQRTSLFASTLRPMYSHVKPFVPTEISMSLACKGLYGCAHVPAQRQICHCTEKVHVVQQSSRCVAAYILTPIHISCARCRLRTRLLALFQS